MKEIYYSYNNEALASCVLLLVIQQTKEIDYARLCLILPFLFDNRFVNLMEISEQTKLEQLIQEKPILLSAFNKRYLNLMPVTINSLMLLKKSGQINFDKKFSSRSKLNFNGVDLGERFKKIKNVLSSFLALIQEYSTSDLYQTLKVQL